MKLLCQTHSPGARKVLVFAHEAGLADSLEVVAHDTSPTLRNEAVFAMNPLGKVPVLFVFHLNCGTRRLRTATRKD